jgi:hypothetical protein
MHSLRVFVESFCPVGDNNPVMLVLVPPGSVRCREIRIRETAAVNADD